MSFIPKDLRAVPDRPAPEPRKSPGPNHDERLEEARDKALRDSVRNRLHGGPGWAYSGVSLCGDARSRPRVVRELIRAGYIEPHDPNPDQYRLVVATAFAAVPSETPDLIALWDGRFRLDDRATHHPSVALWYSSKVSDAALIKGLILD